MLNEEQIFDYELRSSWLADLFLGTRFAGLIRRYFTWKARRKCRRYVRAKFLQWEAQALAAQAKARQRLRLYRG